MAHDLIASLQELRDPATDARSFSQDTRYDTQVFAEVFFESDSRDFKETSFVQGCLLNINTRNLWEPEPPNSKTPA